MLQQCKVRCLMFCFLSYGSRTHLNQAGQIRPIQADYNGVLIATLTFDNIVQPGFRYRHQKDYCVYTAKLEDENAVIYILSYNYIRYI